MGTQDREARIRRVTWLGLWTNLGLSAVKFAAGTLGHSRAVVADAVHSLSDCGSDVAVLVGTRLWSQPRDSDHPYGHARIEAFVTVLLGLSLFAVGVGMGYAAVVNIRAKGGAPPSVVALVAAAVSMVVKEALYRWTVRVGREERSSAMVANAWHHRSDALSSLPAAVAVGAAMLLPGWPFLDSLGAVVVCLLIVQAAWRIVRPAVGQLIDRGLPPRECEAILAAVRAVEGVEQAHDLRTRRLGPGVALDIHVEVEPSLTVTAGHGIAEAARDRIFELFPDGIDVVVHIDPHGLVPDGRAGNLRPAR